MGQRGGDREPATADDLAQMRQLATEAVRVGALGFASSRLATHRTDRGQQIPSYDAGENEILEIARGIADGGGLIQFVLDLPADGYQSVLQPVFDAANAQLTADIIHLPSSIFHLQLITSCTDVI
jgi:N-acyl-D-aspartate/D-glutamate deacylase